MTTARLHPFDLLGPGGEVARKLPAFEARAEQIAMANCVADAFANRRHAVIEAGTGVGKSFGYLVPAILHALETKKPVVVATNTIALQEQLANKDIPFLQSALPVKFTAVLAKGRGNYVSIRRLRKAAASARSLFDGDASVEQLDRLVEWVEETDDGSLADLPFDPLPGVWEQAQSDRSNCLGRKCPSHKDCFYFAARKRYALANVLIVNHHLLFTDLAVRSRSGTAGILPKYGAVVIDEAHATEDVASHCLGHRLSEAQIRRYLLGLFNARRNKGVLTDFRSMAATNARVAVATTLDATKAFFAQLQDWALANQPSGRGREGRLEPVRVREPLPYIEALSDAFANLQESLYALKETMTEEEDELEIESQIGRAMEHIGTVKLFLHAGDDESVFWVEPAPRPREGAKDSGDEDGDDRPRRSATLNIAPIEVGPLLRRDLFDKVDTVVLTSATIASGSGARAFDHFCERVGLTGSFTAMEEAESDASVGDLAFDLERGAQPLDSSSASADDALADTDTDDQDHHEELDQPVDDDDQQARADLIARRRPPLRLHLGSPFDFAANVRLVVPRDLPDPRDAKSDDVMVRWISHLIDANLGATFVLFTNTGQMNRAAERVQAILGDAYPILKQGDGASRSQLLDRFKRETASVLFGVASFWQGVDVPGDALTQVIIARLPFAVPSDPIVAARSERIESRGGHAFGDYSLPEAIIKFKQGFGRLIRTSTDKGAVVVLDPRIVTKPYGRRFINALPSVPLDRPTLPEQLL